ncbi:hypothetical protein [Epilithonimonas vandammei]|uniref:hypothetical protein n=1 Tax=Epilithonimonas vandammei TaxID=2487072 RepID=UPI001E45EF0C|nr:hypothetical protein [Epilithonimonas vandammei]
MKMKITSFALLATSLFYSQQIDTQTRDDAGSYGANFKSGFFQTEHPVNYPTSASTEWWHLLDIRHTNPNNMYAMQFAGAFGDENLWFRKTNDDASNSWSKVVLQDPNGNIGIDGNSGFEKFYIKGTHETATALIHASNGSQPHAFLTFWASEPGSSFTGVGIGNNVRNYNNSQTFTRIGNNQGGSYLRLLDNEINFNLISSTGAKQQTLTLASTGSVGIGKTTNPRAKVDIANNNDQSLLLNYQDKSAVTFIPNNGNSWFSISHGLSNDLAISQGGNVDHERLVTIKNSGYVGIGKNNPLARLDVLGSIIVGDNDNYFSYNGADINLKAISRGTGGRALVHDGGNILTLNYDGDFTGGIKIAGSTFIKNNGNASFQGKIEAKEIKVTQSPTADFVFADDYALPNLDAVEKHIKEKKHLPEIASAKEMEKDGVNVGEFQIKLLQKIEELTLYSIEQNKINKQQEDKIERLEKLVQALVSSKK